MQTTLLNHILTAQHGKRIAVIENEVFIFFPAFMISYKLYMYMLDENETGQCYDLLMITMVAVW